MDELSADIAPQVLAACTGNAEEAAAAFGRAFEGDFILEVGESGPHDVGAASLSWPGLAVLLTYGQGRAAAITLGTSSGMLPEWVREPDTTCESKLNTLAQELSGLLMPEGLVADGFRAAWVENLAEGIDRAAPAEGASCVTIKVATGGKSGELRLVWPLTKSEELFESSEERASEDTEPTAEPEERPVSQARVRRWSGNPPRDFNDLPPNSLTALRVEVPLSVNLATKKAEVAEIVELGPGSIITFDKSCDENLEITVGGQPVAIGEAVKVGENFGVRVRQMTLPGEHFSPMLPPHSS